MINKKSLGTALNGCVFVTTILFIASTILWIFITPYKMKEYDYVLS